MELVSSSSPCLPKDIKLEHFFEFEQDGLFFGLEFLQDSLSRLGFQDSSIRSYVKEGGIVFKGQVAFSLQIGKKDVLKQAQFGEDLLSVVSYLSGAYSLFSSWGVKHFPFLVCASPTEGFSLSTWEEKAILKARLSLQKKPLQNVCQSKEEVSRALNRSALNQGEKHIILNCSRMSDEEVKSFLREGPSFVSFSLCGGLMPSDLEKWEEFFISLKSVHPLCLQGFFPRIKIKSKNFKL